MTKIIVGISGGIDSAVTAYTLKKEGYEVIGAHLQISDELHIPQGQLNRISEALSIPIHIIDGRKPFKETVIEAFRNDHLAGRTPSPCATCNPTLKWKLLFDKARQENADYIASGHYIQKEFKDGIWYLKKAVDLLKDQSYYLWGLDQEKLNGIITPLGKTNKQEVKTIASEIGLEFLINKKESSGLCFAQGLTYTELLKKYIPETAKIESGDVFSKSGELIGKHQGYIYYTIGQKRNIDYFDEQYLGNCVSSIDAQRNTLTIDSEESLWCKEFVIDKCFFTNEKRVLESNKLEVKVRGIGRNPVGFAKVAKLNNTNYQVVLENPAWAMAPGQPVVFYENDYLLGGGLMLK
jgi:tRNA-uridine 2-sulfurtransferase